MLPFIEQPLWTKWPFVISLILTFSILSFFTFYDTAWYPPQTFEYSLHSAIYAVLSPALFASSDFIFGRIFRIPVRWKFLWRLQIALLVVLLPFNILQFFFESFHPTYVIGSSIYLVSFGVFIIFWASAFWRKYRPEAHAFQVGGFLTLGVVVFSLISISTISQMKPCLKAAQPWTMVELNRVRVFYTDSEPDTYAKVKITAKRIEIMLGKVESTLQSRPIAEKINVFLFPDHESLMAFNGDSTIEWEVGVAGVKGILLFNSDWSTMRSTISHEMTHLVLAQEVGENMLPLVNEGTAVWVENKLGAGEDTIPIKKQQISTATLASETAFFPQEDDDEAIDANYAHAGWLAKGSIEKHGLKKWKQLARLTGTNYWRRTFGSDQAEERFRAGFKSIYNAQIP